MLRAATVRLRFHTVCLNYAILAGRARFAPRSVTGRFARNGATIAGRYHTQDSSKPGQGPV
jgi:hypothetical protein